MKLKKQISASWATILAEEFEKSYFKELEAFVL
jgi:uracil DNA glycosylase